MRAQLKLIVAKLLLIVQTVVFNQPCAICFPMEIGVCIVYHTLVFLGGSCLSGERRLSRV